MAAAEPTDRIRQVLGLVRAQQTQPWSSSSANDPTVNAWGGVEYQLDSGRTIRLFDDGTQVLLVITTNQRSNVDARFTDAPAQAIAGLILAYL